MTDQLVFQEKLQLFGSELLNLDLCHQIYKFLLVFSPGTDFKVWKLLTIHFLRTILQDPTDFLGNLWASKDKSTFPLKVPILFGNHRVCRVSLSMDFMANPRENLFFLEAVYTNHSNANSLFSSFHQCFSQHSCHEQPRDHLGLERQGQCKAEGGGDPSIRHVSSSTNHFLVSGCWITRDQTPLTG